MAPSPVPSPRRGEGKEDGPFRGLTTAGDGGHRTRDPLRANLVHCLSPCVVLCRGVPFCPGRPWALSSCAVLCRPALCRAVANR